MSSQGFFHQPLKFYHGRIPFIVVDLIKRLKELDAESSADILNEDNVGNNIDQIINELDMKPIKNWKNYKNVSTLSIALVRYLNSITFDEPLFTNPCKDALIEANLTLKTPNYAHIFRKNLVNLYPGNYRTILAVTDFLRNVETTSLDIMFEQFGPSFFGKNAIQRNRAQFRVLFILLLIHHSEIFKGAILGPAAYLTPQQIAVLERRIIEKSSSNNSSAEREAALITPRNAVAPHTPKSPPASYSQKKQTKTREIKSKQQFLSSDDENYDIESRNEDQLNQTYSETYSENFSQQNNDDQYTYSYETVDQKDSKIKGNGSSKNSHSMKTLNKSGAKAANKNTKSSKSTKNTRKSHERAIELNSKEDDRNLHEKVFSPTFSNVIVADIKPNTVYAEASAQAACLTMTAVKAIFSNDAQSKKKFKRKTIRITRKRTKSTENDDSDEKDEYSDQDNDFINERNAQIGNNDSNSNNTDDDNDVDKDTDKDINNSNNNDVSIQSDLCTSESYIQNAMNVLNVDGEGSASDIFRTD